MRLAIHIKLLLTTVLCVGLVLAGASPALAWANGVDGPNSYGTHDWVLDHAIDALGHRAGWVCVGAALKATDDPETKDGLDHASGTWWHVYDIWGTTWGDAPECAEAVRSFWGTGSGDLIGRLLSEETNIMYVAAYMDLLRDTATPGASWRVIYQEVSDPAIGSYNAYLRFGAAFVEASSYYSYLDQP